MVLPSMPIIIIIIIIITRPKPAYGRQGLANILLRASGAQLRSDEVIDKHTLYHNIYIIIRPKPAYGRQGLAGVLPLPLSSGGESAHFS